MIPTLRPDDVVVADILDIDTGRAVRRAIRGAGCHLPFLTPYGPDLNPIEQVLAMRRTLPRTTDARSIATVRHCICGLFARLTLTECANYLRHAGYA